MSKFMLHFLFAVISTMILSCTTHAAPHWPGNYLYEHELKEAAGGLMPIVQYQLTLNEDLACTLEISGHQIDEQIKCLASPQKNSLKIMFKSYSSGDTKNAYGVEIYKPEQTLFVLQNKEKN
jgi:hypothetical protein